MSAQVTDLLQQLRALWVARAANGRGIADAETIPIDPAPARANSPLEEGWRRQPPGCFSVSGESTPNAETPRRSAPPLYERGIADAETILIDPASAQANSPLEEGWRRQPPGCFSVSGEPAQNAETPRRSASPLYERGIAHEAATALARWPLTVPQPLTVTATGHAILQYLPDNLATSPSAALRALGAVAAVLPWKYNYLPGRGGDADAGRVAWAEFIGPAAPIVSDELCVGITLIAPRTLYPAHRHPAAELYYVLSGTARWQSPAADADRAPGEFIFHPPNVVHAMETRDEPLLAAYTWTGDVRALSQYV